MKKSKIICIVLVLLSLTSVVPVLANGGNGVEIDIKPMSCPSSINPNSKGNIPVAIKTTDSFDATDVDPPTVLFADASPLRWSLEDFDGDGDIDLILKFKTQECNLPADDDYVELTGLTMGGTPFSALGWVNIVP